MDYNLKNQLYEYMVSKGVERDIAERAAHKCTYAIARGAVVGSVSLTAALVFLTKQPAAMIGAVPAGAAAGTAFALFSGSCEEVRNAAFNWAQF